MEGRKRWNSRANEKQYLHNVEKKQSFEDIRRHLEEHFGTKESIPGKIEDAIKIGEKKVDDRVKMLKMADQASWLAVDKYIADPLCNDAEDDRKWKAAMKEAKEEQNKRKSCLLYTSPSPRDGLLSRMPSSA